MAVNRFVHPATVSEKTAVGASASGVAKQFETVETVLWESPYKGGYRKSSGIGVQTVSTVSEPACEERDARVNVGLITNGSCLSRSQRLPGDSDGGRCRERRSADRGVSFNGVGPRHYIA